MSYGSDAGQMDLSVSATSYIDGYDGIVVVRNNNLQTYPINQLANAVMPSISMLPLAGPLDGDEYIPIVQYGTTKRIMVRDLLRAPQPAPAIRSAPTVVRTPTDEDDAIDIAIQAARSVA